MEYYKETKTKDNRKLILRSATRDDAEDYISYFVRAHGETDFLTTYPDEVGHDACITADKLEAARSSGKALEICAFVDGKLVGSAGIDTVRDRAKTSHRAELGISILKEYHRLGIGSELTAACIDMARQAGYLQLELEVVADNAGAICLYKKFGFSEFGRNPKAFRTRDGRFQELILMRSEL